MRFSTAAVIFAAAVLGSSSVLAAPFGQAPVKPGQANQVQPKPVPPRVRARDLDNELEIRDLNDANEILGRAPIMSLRGSRVANGVKLGLLGSKLRRLQLKRKSKAAPPAAASEAAPAAPAGDAPAARDLEEELETRKYGGKRRRGGPKRSKKMGGRKAKHAQPASAEAPSAEAAEPAPAARELGFVDELEVRKYGGKRRRGGARKSKKNGGSKAKIAQAGADAAGQAASTEATPASRELEDFEDSL